MPTIERNDEDFELWVLLHQTRDAIFKAREKELARFGTSTMVAGALFIINSIRDPATPAEVSRWIFREPHTVTALLKRMEQDGLITRTKDLPRANMVRISLTEKGKLLLALVQKRESTHQIFNALTPQAKGHLRWYLNSLRESALSQLNSSAPPFPNLDAEVIPTTVSG
jgi:DNA-binding MarR family transcriptional regulator